MQRSACACTFVDSFIISMHSEEKRKLRRHTRVSRLFHLPPEASSDTGGPLHHPIQVLEQKRDDAQHTVWLGTTEPPAASVNGRRVERVAASAGDRAANLQEFQ